VLSYIINIRSTIVIRATCTCSLLSFAEFKEKRRPRHLIKISSIQPKKDQILDNIITCFWSFDIEYSICFCKCSSSSLVTLDLFANRQQLLRTNMYLARIAFFNIYTDKTLVRSYLKKKGVESMCTSYKAITSLDIQAPISESVFALIFVVQFING
jgi:hypothetical protein